MALKNGGKGHLVPTVHTFLKVLHPRPHPHFWGRVIIPDPDPRPYPHFWEKWVFLKIHLGPKMGVGTGVLGLFGQIGHFDQFRSFRGLQCSIWGHLVKWVSKWNTGGPF